MELTMNVLSFYFITDAKVRIVIEEYWSQAKKAYDCEVFAGTVFLCGAVLEGLIAWAITCVEDDARKKFPDEFKYKNKGKENGKENDKPISKWGLTELIKVSKGLDLIGKPSSRLLEAVQDFRNFIHPFNAKQHSDGANERIAAISLKTVEEVYRSLTGRMKNLG
jgi:hypothetical protein